MILYIPLWTVLDLLLDFLLVIPYSVYYSVLCKCNVEVIIMMEIKNVIKRCLFDSPASVAEYLINMLREYTHLTDNRILMNTIIDFIFTASLTSTFPILIFANIQTYTESPVNCIIQCIFLVLMLAVLLKLLAISYCTIKILKNKR